jgi:hypothetical protein
MEPMKAGGAASTASTMNAVRVARSG